MLIETLSTLTRTLRAESVTACREFPADSFDAELVPGFMTFRRLHQHILEVHFAVTGLLLDGEEHFNTAEIRPKFKNYLPLVSAEAAPEELAQALETRMQQRLAEMSAAAASFWEVTHFSGARVTMMEMLLLLRHHEGEHRAQAAVLSRLCGVIPATTRQRLATQKAAAK
jgi:uncharacterized damage-inducible protein DinB